MSDSNLANRMICLSEITAAVTAFAEPYARQTLWPMSRRSEVAVVGTDFYNDYLDDYADYVKILTESAIELITPFLIFPPSTGPMQLPESEHPDNRVMGPRLHLIGWEDDLARLDEVIKEKAFPPHLVVRHEITSEDCHRLTGIMRILRGKTNRVTLCVPVWQIPRFTRESALLELSDPRITLFGVPLDRFQCNDLVNLTLVELLAMFAPKT